MQLQKTGLDSQQTVICRVGFVEAVAGKLIPIVIDALSGGTLHALGHRPLHEFVTLLFNFLGFFL